MALSENHLENKPILQKLQINKNITSINLSSMKETSLDCQRRVDV